MKTLTENWDLQQKNLPRKRETLPDFVMCGFSKVSAVTDSSIDPQMMATLVTTCELFKPLTSIQITAMDLYDRGLNVFPVPRPEEVRQRAPKDPRDQYPYRKPPYLNRPLFTSRLHKCNKYCLDKQSRTGKSCLPPDAIFEALFERTNIAVMLGRTSGNLTAIDCDTRQAFENIRLEFDHRNIPYWAYTSHRGGTYLIRLCEGEAKNMPKDGKYDFPFPDIEIYGNRHYVVIPPSLHPAGTFYQWVKGCPGEPIYHLPPGVPPPLIHLQQLEWLGVSLSKQDRKQWVAPDVVDGKPWTALLSRNNRHILNSALIEGTRNTSLTKPTYDIAALIKGGEVSYTDGLRLLLDSAGRCQYPADNVRQMLNSALHKPDLTPAAKFYNNMKAHQPKAWEKALSFATSWKWAGRTAQSDRSVFLSCVQRARLDEREVFRCSEREIAELAACDRLTARKALRRLSGGNTQAKTPILLGFVCYDVQSGASMYRFADFPLLPSITTPLSPLVVCGGVVMEGMKPNSRAEQDLFGRQKVAWGVWRHLCLHSEPSKGAIARATGICWSSVSRSLKWLMQLGMVSYSTSEGLYFGEYFTDEALNEIANSLNQAGRSEKRRFSHRLEREKRVNIMLARAREKWRNDAYGCIEDNGQEI